MANGRFSALVLPLGIILLATMVHSNFCPDAKLCDCTPNYVNCTCLKEEAIAIVYTSQTFTVKEFIVSGCGRVHLKERSLSDKDIQLARFSNLTELYVEQHALQNGKIKDLVFHNIRNFTLEDNAFAEIKGIASLIMKNVALEKAAYGMFSGTTIPVLVIEDSRIKTISASSFQLKQSSRIRIENNTIGAIPTSSFRIESTENFFFIYNSVASTETFSFTFKSVKNVHFVNCRFDKIPPTMILTKKVQEFKFNKNYIRECEERAFSAIRECRSISFIDNQVLIARNNSLIPNKELNEEELRGMTSENNEIGCDCGIEWLVATNSPRYVDFKEKNICHYPNNLKGLKLSLLEVERSNEDGCSALGSVSAAATEIPSAGSTSLSEAAGIEGNPIIIVNPIETTTDSGADQSAEFSSGKQVEGDEAPCTDDENSGSGSPGLYPLAATVLLLPLIISINGLHRELC